MGTLTGTYLAAQTRLIINDSAGDRWADAELLKWINDGQREVVLLKPSAKPVNEEVTLVQGTKQSIPTGGVQLLSVIRNVDGNGIRRVERAVMDGEDPSWHEATADNTVLHYMFDEDDPKTFYVYPPQTATPGDVEILYSKVPTDLSVISDTIDLDDIYGNVLVDYMCFRAFSKDSDFQNGAQRAATHYQLYNQALGNRVQLERFVSPNSPPNREQG